MKHVQYLPLFLFLFISQTIAQVPTFDLATYARPILKRQSLDMATDIDASQYSRPFYQPSNASSSRSVGGNLWLRYQYLHNDLQYQGNSSLILSINPLHSRLEFPDEYLGNQLALQQHTNLSSVHRWYNRKQYFWGFEGNVEQNHQRFSSREERMTPLEEKKDSRLDSNLELILDLPIVVGKGRLEPIQDARHGLFILQALEKQGLLAREIQEQDILAFAAQISQWKNRRYFDIRLQRIWELEQIHTYLLAQGIIEELSPTLFAIVQDLWSFGYQIVRWAGNRTSIGIDPNVRLLQQTSNNQTVIMDSVSTISEQNARYHLLQLHPSLFFAYVSEKPLSESWQRSLAVELEIGPSQEQYKRIRTQNGSNSETKGSYWRDLPLSRASFRYAIGYYPNTRTFVEGEIRSDWGQELFLSTPLTGSWNEPIAASRIQNALNINAYYYLSPRTRLILTYGGSLTARRQDLEPISPIDFIDELRQGTQFRQSLNLRFEYAWF